MNNADTHFVTDIMRDIVDELRQEGRVYKEDRYANRVSPLYARLVIAYDKLEPNNMLPEGHVEKCKLRWDDYLEREDGKRCWDCEKLYPSEDDLDTWGQCYSCVEPGEEIQFTPEGDFK